MPTTDGSPDPPSKHELPHVLVVDDEDRARESLGAILEDGYRVTLASSGEEALKILRDQPVSVVCTDFQMPGMNGLELLGRMTAVSPRAVGVLVTGFPELSSAGADDHGHLVVVKPFTPERLLRIVAQAVSFSQIRALGGSEGERPGSRGP